MNTEKYQDPTAEKAIGHVMAEQRAAERRQTPPTVMQVINMIKAVAGVAGFEVVGRIVLRDKETGHEWR